MGGMCREEVHMGVCVGKVYMGGMCREGPHGGYV